MANRGTSRPTSGESRDGTQRDIGVNTWRYVEAPSGYVGGIILSATNGTSTYLWVDTNGKLRIATTEPTAPNTDGTVVGAQTA